MIRAVLVITLLAALVAGCATSPVDAPDDAPGQAPETAPATGSPTEAPAPANAPERQTDSATLALLKQSERAADSGDLGSALAYAERAVRLEPQRADLWTRLASLELDSSRPETAVQYARKALSLARDRPDWQRDAWLVIARAREMQGDTEGAEAIRERWKTYRG
jgi:tetratricopeptide (TPR) repeat protein